MKPRNYHAAGIVTDLVTDEQLVAVTGGWSCDILTSTEILQDEEWVQGKTDKSILYISKKNPNFFLKNLYESFSYSFQNFEGTFASTETS